MATALPPRSVGLVVVESSVSVLLVLSALLGNSILLASLCRKPRLKSSTGILIGALAVTDLLNACIPGALFWSTLLTGKMSFSNLGCQISGFFMHFLTYASMATMALTAINRFFCVLKPDVYKNAFSYRRSMLYITSLWLFVAAVVCLPILSGWSKFAFNPMMAACVMKFTNPMAEIGYTSFIVAVFVVCCFGVVSLCYFRVSRFIRQHNQNNISLSAQEIRLTKALFVLVFTFAVLWIPAFIAIVLFRLVLKAKVPRAVVLVVPYLVNLSCALNPWIYGVMCPVVREKMKRGLRFAHVSNAAQPSLPNPESLWYAPGNQRQSETRNTAMSIMPNVSSSQVIMTVFSNPDRYNTGGCCQGQFATEEMLY